MCVEPMRFSRSVITWCVHLCAVLSACDFCKVQSSASFSTSSTIVRLIRCGDFIMQRINTITFDHENLFLLFKKNNPLLPTHLFPWIVTTCKTTDKCSNCFQLFILNVQLLNMCSVALIYVNAANFGVIFYFYCYFQWQTCKNFSYFSWSDSPPTQSSNLVQFGTSRDLKNIYIYYIILNHHGLQICHVQVLELLT